MSKTAQSKPVKRSGEQPRKGGSFVRGADGNLTPAQGSAKPAPSDEQNQSDSQPDAGKKSGQDTSKKDDGK